jgi:hypothetical protein
MDSPSIGSADPKLPPWAAITGGDDVLSPVKLHV